MNDVLIDEDRDIIIENGDFKWGESTYQEVQSLLETPPGTCHTNGYFGIDLINELDEDGLINFKPELKKQLKLDNKKLKTYIIDGSKLSIDVENL